MFLLLVAAKVIGHAQDFVESGPMGGGGGCQGLNINVFPPSLGVAYINFCLGCFIFCLFGGGVECTVVSSSLTAGHMSRAQNA